MSITAALIAAAVGATASGVTSGIGASKAAKERKKAELLLKQREDEARANYIVDKNKNYLDTAEARYLLNQSAQRLRDLNKSNKNSAIKTGATEENKLAATEKANIAHSNLLGNLASQSTRYREGLENRYLQRQGQFDAMRFNNIENNAQSIGNTYNNIGQGIGNLSQAFMTAYNPTNNTKTSPVSTPMQSTTPITLQPNPYSLENTINLFKKPKNVFGLNN